MILERKPAPSFSGGKIGHKSKTSSYAAASKGQRRIGGQLPTLYGSSGKKVKTKKSENNRDKINQEIDVYNQATSYSERQKSLAQLTAMAKHWKNKVSTLSSKKKKMVESLISEIALDTPVVDQKVKEYAGFYEPEYVQYAQQGGVTLPDEAGDIRIQNILDAGNITAAGFATALSPNNLLAFEQFIKNNPTLIQAFGEGGLLAGNLRMIELESRQGMGGGEYLNDTVHISRGEGQKDSFMPLLVHEMGHASLQRLLEIESGSIPTSQDGQALHQAWLVLKEDTKNFVGHEMGEYKPFGSVRPKPRHPEDRQHYQGTALIEFVAESFMHMALVPGKIEEHVKQIKSDPLVSQQVKAAWDTALDILQRNGRRLLG